jgi:protein-L-isoaspartate(D-aspartate) O-methyltransferase
MVSELEVRESSINRWFLEKSSTIRMFFQSSICNRQLLRLLGFGFIGLSFIGMAQDDPYRLLREEMVRTQLGENRWTGAPAVRDPQVLQAMREVPRHLFVPPELIPNSYEDRPLPIGLGQTISQPYIVAKMTELAAPKKSDRALEIGTGSGYQAAVLSTIVAEVNSIEIVEPLGTEARNRLRTLGYRNVEVRIGDGYAGWPEKAPFDIILVTAAPPEIPPKLVEQLKPGGRMVAPVGGSPSIQSLLLITKNAKGEVNKREIMPVAFVPMVPGKK